MSTMRDRLRGVLIQFGAWSSQEIDILAEFYAAELRLEQQPGEVPEGLEAAERLLRVGGPHGSVRLETSEREAIAAELVRLRATNKLQETELAALWGEALREHWMVAETIDEALDAEATGYSSYEDAASYEEDDLHVYHVRTAATLVPSKETP
jgi:hypothetical protein